MTMARLQLLLLGDENNKPMSELHIIEKPITKDKTDDSREREMLLWVKYSFRQYYEGEITKEQLKEVLVLGIENILDR